MSTSLHTACRAMSVTTSSSRISRSSPCLGSTHKFSVGCLSAASSRSFVLLPPIPTIRIHGQSVDKQRIRPIATASGIAFSADEDGNILPPGASWAVHKFGGTCMATSERIKNVAEIIAEDTSKRKVAVVSAMSEVTDMMYDLVSKAQKRDHSYKDDLNEVYEKHKETALTLLEDGKDLSTFLSCLEADIYNLRAMLRAICIAGCVTETLEDWVVGHGELWSAKLLASAVRKSGLPCVWMDARDVLVVTPTGKQQVDPDKTKSKQKLQQWYSRYPSDTIVVTGFIASTPENIPTTLKRGGSDLSAAIMGALLQASKVTIWTDVDGVYSADPKKVSEAVLLKFLSYQEAWELSYFGANVLHPRTTIPVMAQNIPIVIRNVLNVASPGTEIGRFSDSVYAGSPQPPSNAARVVKGISTVDSIALINVEGTGMAGVPGTACDIFETVKGVGANVVMISQASSEHSVCFAVPEKDADTVRLALLLKFNRDLHAERLSKVEVVKHCCILAAVGQRMACNPGVSAHIFDALAKARINVRAIAQGCSEHNITVVVDQNDSVRALNAVHSRFYHSGTPLAVGLIGPGSIGKSLLNQFKDQVATLKKDSNVDLRVMGIKGRKTMYLSETAIDLSNWEELLHTKGVPENTAEFTAHMLSHSLPNTVFVDCTAEDEVAHNYHDWLTRGIHIVTPNKKANSGPYAQYAKLRQVQRQSNTLYFYEGTVGAGLPIISTLRGLIETGDKILTIEGVFSGTLSYLFNEFNGEKPFSQIVVEARAKGYTEPNPKDDLSGMDVARKVTILARECGLQLELDDVKIDEDWMTKHLLSLESAEDFLKDLPSFDETIEARRAEAEAAGEVLRFVGIVDVVNKKGEVKLVRKPKSDAFAHISGADNIIAFTTGRYNSDQRLIVRGPGAGPEVTAAGVFSDLLRVAFYSGAPL